MNLVLDDAKSLLEDIMCVKKSAADMFMGCERRRPWTLLIRASWKFEPITY